MLTHFDNTPIPFKGREGRINLIRLSNPATPSRVQFDSHPRLKRQLMQNRIRPNGSAVVPIF